MILFANQIAYSNSDLSNSLTFTAGDNSFSISGIPELGSAISTSDRYNMFVLYPGYDFGSVISTSDANDIIAFASCVNKLKYGQKFTMGYKLKENSAYGKYNIRLTCTRSDGNVEEIYYKFYNTDPSALDQFIKKFDSASSNQIASLISQYAETEEIMDFSIIKHFPETISDTFSKNFVIARKAILGELKSKSDVIACLETAIMLTAFNLENQQYITTLFSDYSKYLDGIFDFKADLQKWLVIYSDLKHNIVNSDDFLKVYKMCNILSYIQNSTNVETANVLKTYNNELGIDISYAEKNSISLGQVAQKIDKNKASKLFDDFNSQFIKIVDNLVLEAKSSPISSSPVTKSRPDSRNNTVQYSSEISVLTLPETNIIKEYVEKLYFIDLDSVSWAKEQIYRLAEKSIISGTAEGVFEPDREVSREEFVKMLVLAGGLQVNGNSDIIFDDCSKDAWYYPYIRIGFACNIFKGVSKNEFGIGKNIIRQDIAVMARKVLEANGIKLIDDVSLDYNDTHLISDYAASSIKTMSKIGVISGFDDKTFRPTEFATRAQTAVIIDRLIEYISGVKK